MLNRREPQKMYCARLKIIWTFEYRSNHKQELRLVTMFYQMKIKLVSFLAPLEHQLC